MNEIFKRISIRKWEDKPVEDEKITAILKAAMQAPSAGNQRPWDFYVVTEKNTILELSKASKYSGCAANAPVAIVPCMKTKEAMFQQLVEVDNAITTEHILLEIVSQGLGGVWLAVAPFEDRIEIVRKALNLPDNLVPFAIVPYIFSVPDELQYGWIFGGYFADYDENKKDEYSKILSAEFKK